MKDRNSEGHEGYSSSKEGINWRSSRAVSWGAEVPVEDFISYPEELVVFMKLHNPVFPQYQGETIGIVYPERNMREVLDGSELELEVDRLKAATPEQVKDLLSINPLYEIKNAIREPIMALGRFSDPEYTTMGVELGLLVQSMNYDDTSGDKSVKQLRKELKKEQEKHKKNNS